MIGVASLLIVVTLGLMIARVAAVAGTRGYRRGLRAPSPDRGPYSIDEIDVDDDDWVEGRPLHDLRLNREGVVVLGVRRTDGGYVGVPSGGTTIQAGDTVIVYGEAEQLDEVHDHKEGASGDEAHEQASARRRRLLHHEEDALLQGGPTQ